MSKPNVEAGTQDNKERPVAACSLSACPFPDTSVLRFASPEGYTFAIPTCKFLYVVPRWVRPRAGKYGLGLGTS